MAKICSIDNEKLGLGGTIYKLKDGNICSKHAKMTGLTLRDLKNKTVAEMQELFSETTEIANAFGVSDVKDLPKNQQKVFRYLVNRGLQNLSPEIYKEVEKVVTDLSGTGLMKMGQSLSVGSTADKLQTAYLSALVEQNWIQMKQNDELINVLKSLRN